MPKESAGLLMFRGQAESLEVLLVHPGGPFFRNKDEGVWTIPKGEIGLGEDRLSAAIREFEEELGSRPSGPYIPLPAIHQKGGKTVHAWACAGNLDTTAIVSNLFSMEWPPRSGRTAEFPEVDRAAFFDLPTAANKIHLAQATWLDQLPVLMTSSRNTGDIK